MRGKHEQETQTLYFDAAYKLQVVNMVRGGLSVVQMVTDQHVGESAVRRWLKQFAAEQNGAVLPGSKPLTLEQIRIHAGKSGPRPEQGSRHPKKASAFFAREPK